MDHEPIVGDGPSKLPSLSSRQAAIDRAKEQDEATRAYVKEVAGSGTSSADEVAKLAELRDKGVLSEEEFQQAKAKALGGDG